jgi:16S rRNA (cytidine1402-2'-O)-methyltransferase
MPGTLFVVATPIGNLEDMTGRGLRVLREAALIAAEDTRRTSRLLAHYGITTPTTSLHEHNEYQKGPLLLDRLRRGEHIALVSDAGTPTVSDPGQRLVDSALQAGLRVESVPGPSAALAALSASGLPADTFTFLGFPPIRSKDRIAWFDQLAKAGRTVIFFEAPHRIRATLEELQHLIGDRAIVMAHELTKIHEKVVKQPISTVIAELERPVGEYTVLVDMGLKTENNVPAELDAALIEREIGVLTNTTALTKRQQAKLIARKHHLRPNDVYRALERRRLLVDKQKPGK